MAGGGLDSSYEVEKGAPYLLAYWGYHMEPEWWHMHFGNIPPNPMHCLTANVLDSEGDTIMFTPEEVYICNHPWPYYGNMYGDGFARPLNQPGDEFSLIIHAIKVDGREDSLKVSLAEYDDGLIQSPNWEKIDLNFKNFSNNDSIKTLYFTMKTTDKDNYWGPNTAVYFCMDKLKVTKQGKVPSALSAPAQRTALKTFEQQPKTMVTVSDYFPLPSQRGGSVVVLDLKGNEVLNTSVKAGDRINLSALPAGEYLLKHGQRLLPFSKN